MGNPEGGDGPVRQDDMYMALLRAAAWLHSDRPDMGDEYTRGQVELIADSFPPATRDKEQVMDELLELWEQEIGSVLG